MSNPKPDDELFMRRLERNVPFDPPAHDPLEGQKRAALAALRRGLGKEPGEVAETSRVVMGALPDGVKPWQEPSFYLVASLFGLYPRPWHGNAERLHLGGSLSRLRAASESEGPERRMVALLNASSRDLSDHLRYAVSLLKTKDIALDWAQLLRDIQDWDLPDHRVQRDWARAFWAGTTTDPLPERQGGMEQPRPDDALPTA